MTISELTLKSSNTAPTRRIEIFTGSGRPRDWSPEDKARIVAVNSLRTATPFRVQSDWTPTTRKRGPYLMPNHRYVQHRFRQQLLQSAVLVLERLQSLGI